MILDRDDALPYEYRLLSNNAVIHGEAAGRGITATVFRSSPREYANVSVKPHDVKSAKTRADFQFTAQQASFTLRYDLQGSAVTVSLENVDEKPGFQLIDVATPNLATVYEAD